MKESSYITAGFDENIMRDPFMYADPESLYDSVNIGELFAAGSTPVSGELIQAGAVTQDKINGISILGWVGNFLFTALSNTKVGWNIGSITLANGTVYTIQAGDTGDMSAVTYIYFDLAVSATALQKTPTAGTAVGANKILVAVAQNVAVGKLATFQAFSGKGNGVLITADNIAANTITGNEIAANNIITNSAQIANAIITDAKIVSLTANKISTQLVDAQIANIAYAKITNVAVTNAQIVSLDAGKINAGEIVGRNIRSSSGGGQILLSNGDRLYFYDGAGALQGYMYGAGDDLVVGAYDNIQLGAGGTYRMRVTNTRLYFYDPGYSIYWGAEGYGIAADNDKIRVGANWCPNSHRVQNLGAHDREWNDVRVRYANASNKMYADDFIKNSDINLKNSIKNLQGALGKITSLQGISFDWKQTKKEPKDTNKQMGFIAQEVKEIMPELVVENNGKLGVSYMNIIPILVEAIKELSRKVDKLST